MEIKIFKDALALGEASALAAVSSIKTILAVKGSANIILATGASQFATLNFLVSEGDIDWSKVTMFHLDEYVGLPETHPASFRKYLRDRFISRVPSLKSYHLIDAETHPEQECERISKIIMEHPIDLALIGIGENGHIAFNDPPADFDTETPYIIVNLDEACRNQQLGEGWFPSLEDVPTRAISMSVRQILKSKEIICSVPDARKAIAIKNTIMQAVDNLYPSTILKTHPHCTVFLDTHSASMLQATNQ
jgi:glucosamine-6-phosphate deaminase